MREVGRCKNGLDKIKVATLSCPDNLDFGEVGGMRLSLLVFAVFFSEFERILQGFDEQSAVRPES